MHDHYNTLRPPQFQFFRSFSMSSLSFPINIKIVVSTRDMYNRKDESGLFTLQHALSHGSTSIVIDGPGMPSQQTVASVVSTKVPGIAGQKGFETCRFSQERCSGSTKLRLLIECEHHISEKGIEVSWKNDHDIPLEFCLGSSFDDYTEGKPFFAHIQPSALDNFFEESRVPLMRSLGPIQQGMMQQFQGIGCVAMAPVNMKVSFMNSGSLMDTIFVIGNIGENRSVEVHYSPINVDLTTAVVVTVPEDLAGQNQVLNDLSTLAKDAPDSQLNPEVFTCYATMTLPDPMLADVSVRSPTKRKASESDLNPLEIIAPSPKKICTAATNE